MDGTLMVFNGEFPPHDMGPWTWGWSFSAGWFFLLMIAVFWVAVILAIIFFIRWVVISSARKGQKSKAEDSAFEILRMRYAQGEVNKEEFEQKRKDLGH